jgi:hypothetical protein
MNLPLTNEFEEALRAIVALYNDEHGTWECNGYSIHKYRNDNIKLKFYEFDDIFMFESAERTNDEGDTFIYRIPPISDSTQEFLGRVLTNKRIIDGADH